MYVSCVLLSVRMLRLVLTGSEVDGGGWSQKGRRRPSIASLWAARLLGALPASTLGCGLPCINCLFISFE